MVFKRPRNSRDDKSNGSPKRASKGDEQPKKTGNSRANSSSSKLKRNHYSSDVGSDKKATPSGRRRTQSDKPSFDDKPKRSFGGDAVGEKKAFSPRKAPYSGRPTTDDKPKRNFREDSSSEKKTFSARKTPYSGRPTTEDRQKRGFAAKDGVERERSATERKTTKRSTEGGDFRKRSDDSNYKPFRKSENSSYNKPSFKTPRDTEDKPLRARKKATSKDESHLIRLNRYISNAGICSRRKADELISAGVVSVNGEVVSELGYKIDPNKDAVRYNGELLKRERMVYVLLNKPKDYITTTDDPQERRTVMQLVDKASKERIYPIGRLDRNTTGLLLMTNDGDLADKLSHPKNNVVKLYHVELNRSLTQGDLNKIGFGLELEDGFIKPDSVSYVAGATKKEVGIQIHSGKNRIVRRIFEYLGYEVVKLDRVVYANLTKKDLPRGRWRYLDEKEVIQLKHLI